MKSYTDIEQSRILADFLPVESADMRYGYIAPYEFSDRKYDGGYDMIPYHKDFFDRCSNFSPNEYDGELPCWSLAALINVIKPINENTYTIRGTLDRGGIISFDEVTSVMYQEKEMIDAVFEMVVWLKEIGKL